MLKWIKHKSIFSMATWQLLVFKMMAFFNLPPPEVFPRNKLLFLSALLRETLFEFS